MTIPDGATEFGSPTTIKITDVQIDGDDTVHYLLVYDASVGKPKTVVTACGISRTGYSFSVYFPRKTHVDCSACLAVLDETPKVIEQPSTDGL